ncbi:hypothetical protein ASD28_14480 [Massilia sp. Root133]|uniref:McrC family protein n=1 Tax=unclassified Massilia TaxID=2609279 RepID=UPI0006FB7DE5|nr:MULTISPECIES: McrC family protein [unclassified Massilia]KQX98312.1 hypothetical protein ASD28_14480 [Massilia sp. Root133]KQZ46997.1 hypothetical protein ASD92_24375 [Massilia sp. Root1485]
MGVLVLREYERLRKGDRADFANRVVSPAQYAALECLAEDYTRRFGVRVLQYGPRNTLVAQNYVGVLNLGADQVEILPKIDSPEHTLRQNFMRMLAVALELDLHGSDVSAVQHNDDSILEAVISLFCLSLQRELRRGVLRQYVRREAQLSTLKGRMLFSQHLQKNIARPDRVVCEFDEFTEDNPVNRILRAALRILRRASKRPANQSRIAEMLSNFQDVADVPLARLRWHEASIDRNAARYQPVLTLAQLIIQGLAPDILAGAHSGFALLFDMNEMFEMYIGAMVRRIVRAEGVKVHLQGPSLHLARKDDDRPAFRLKPDIVIKEAGRVAHILDTKWKRLNPDQPNDGVASADVYQMNAYASRYEASDVILLYPHHANLGEHPGRRNQYWLAYLNEDTNRRGIAVGTIDLTDLGTVPRQLEALLDVQRPISVAGRTALGA